MRHTESNLKAQQNFNFKIEVVGICPLNPFSCNFVLFLHFVFQFASRDLLVNVISLKKAAVG